MTRLREELRRAGASDARVLITGESGVGKEIVARTLHRASPRAGGPFVEVNGAAIPEDLIESELFGHVKGSFTGATEDRKGKWEAADGGTLFLDEIGDMSPRTQAKILRAIQDGKISRVGPVFAPKRIGASTIAAMAVPPEKLEAVAQKLAEWTLVPAGTEGYRTAEVTLGGIDTREVSSKTMESQKSPGLYFIGEVLDVTGHLGGFNFQWAWASAHAAAQFV